MLNYMTAWMQLNTDRRAVTALEYGLIASLIAVAIIGRVGLAGTNTNSTLGAVVSSAFTSVAVAL